MDMFKELARLATYASWPNNAEMSPLSLARAGFFYSGNRDEVECFQCKIRLKGWTGEHNPMAIHTQAAPHCPLLNETCRDNVSLDSYVSISNNINSRSQDEPLSGVNMIYNRALSRAQKSGLFLNRNVSTSDRINPDFRLLGDERKRLSTFYDWPSNANANPVELARGGFFDKGTANGVQRVHRRGNWEPTDTPRTEHKKHFPVCSSSFHDDNLALETNPWHAKGSKSVSGITTAEQLIFAKDAYGTRPSEIRTRTGPLSLEDFHKVLAVIEDKDSTEVEDVSDIESPPEARVHYEEAAAEESTGDTDLSLGYASASSANNSSIPSADSTPSENTRKKRKKRGKRGGLH